MGMAKEAYYTREHYDQQRRLLINGDPRALICFCVDVSQSMDEWWIEKGGLRRKEGTDRSDGHEVDYFDLRDIRVGYAYYKKLDKLNNTLHTLLSDLKSDPELRNRVAVSIVTYSRYAKVKYDFLDCVALNPESCMCRVEKDETAMGDGIRTSLTQIDEMQMELKEADNDCYTPILVFLTDGTPTDNPSDEFSEVRKRVKNGELYLFPLGIGDGADMEMLKKMFPIGAVPRDFNEKYKMVNPKDYSTIFEEIKEHVRQKQRVMVSEGESIQSTPVIADENVPNNQFGRSVYDDLAALV